MKRLFIIAVTFLSCLIANAQDIVPRVVDVRDVYKDIYHRGRIGISQMGAWKNVVKESPQNQQAWRNLFFATFIGEGNSLSGLNTDDFKKPRTALVMRKMKETIPDSYVFYLCACHFWLEKEWGKWDKDILRKAIELMPNDAYEEDVLRLARMLWEKDCNNKELIAKVYRMIYDKQSYPYREMRYGWNLMQSMPQNSIFIAHDAMDYEPLKVIQEALDERQDITVIPCQFIANREYTDSVCKMLKIKPFVLKKSENVTKEDYVAKFSMHLVKETKRPLYQPFDMINYSNVYMDSLYNEGLLMKYSSKRYDNIGVALRNVKDVYDLKYLTEPPLVRYTQYFDNINEHKIVLALANTVKLFRKRGLTTDANHLYNIIQTYVKKNTDNYLADRIKEIICKYKNEDTPDF